MSESKQQNVAAALADGVAAKLAPSLATLADQNAKMSVTLSATLARLTAIEALLNDGGAGAKRQVRTAAAKPAAKGAAAKDGAPNSKVTNALLFFRFALANDLNGSRDEYATDDVLEDAAADPAVAKKNKDTDPAGYYSVVGAFIWKHMTEEKKGEIRAQFATWKEESAREATAPPLEEEEAEA